MSVNSSRGLSSGGASHFQSLESRRLLDGLQIETELVETSTGEQAIEVTITRSAEVSGAAVIDLTAAGDAVEEIGAEAIPDSVIIESGETSARVLIGLPGNAAAEPHILILTAGMAHETATATQFTDENNEEPVPEPDVTVSVPENPNIKLTGKQADIDKLLAMIKELCKNPAMKQKIESLGAGEDLNISLVSGEWGTTIDDFETGKIDVKDLEACPERSRARFLFHMLVEQNEKQINDVSVYATAHERALLAEDALSETDRIRGTDAVVVIGNLRKSSTIYDGADGKNYRVTVIEDRLTGVTTVNVVTLNDDGTVTLVSDLPPL